MEHFKIRCYGKSELALCYNPHLTPNGARRKLVQWITHNTELAATLEKMGGMNNDTRCYTPAQVKVIVEFLGEP